MDPDHKKLEEKKDVHIKYYVLQPVRRVGEGLLSRLYAAGITNTLQKGIPKEKIRPTFQKTVMDCNTVRVGS